MDPRTATRGQPDVAGHDHHDPPVPANLRQTQREGLAVRVLIMAEHDAGDAARQTSGGGAGVRQPARIGEQPQRGPVMACREGPAQSQKLAIHNVS